MSKRNESAYLPCIRPNRTCSTPVTIASDQQFNFHDFTHGELQSMGHAQSAWSGTSYSGDSKETARDFFPHPPVYGYPLPPIPDVYQEIMTQMTSFRRRALQDPPGHHFDSSDSEEEPIPPVYVIGSDRIYLKNPSSLTSNTSAEASTPTLSKSSLQASSSFTSTASSFEKEKSCASRSSSTTGRFGVLPSLPKAYYDYALPPLPMIYQNMMSHMTSAKTKIQDHEDGEGTQIPFEQLSGSKKSSNLKNPILMSANSSTGLSASSFSKSILKTRSSLTAERDGLDAPSLTISPASTMKREDSSASLNTVGFQCTAEQMKSVKFSELDTLFCYSSMKEPGLLSFLKSSISSQVENISNYPQQLSFQDSMPSVASSNEEISIQSHQLMHAEDLCTRVSVPRVPYQSADQDTHKVNVYESGPLCFGHRKQAGRTKNDSKSRTESQMYPNHQPERAQSSKPPFTTVNQEAYDSANYNVGLSLSSSCEERFIESGLDYLSYHPHAFQMEASADKGEDSAQILNTSSSESTIKKGPPPRPILAKRPDTKELTSKNVGAKNDADDMPFTEKSCNAFNRQPETRSLRTARTHLAAKKSRNKKVSKEVSNEPFKNQMEVTTAKVKPEAQPRKTELPATDAGAKLLRRSERMRQKCRHIRIKRVAGATN